MLREDARSEVLGKECETEKTVGIEIRIMKTKIVWVYQCLRENNLLIVRLAENQ